MATATTEQERPSRLGTLLLGGLVWVFVLLVPWLHVHATVDAADAVRVAALAAPLVLLVAGVATGSDALLLVGFPLLLLPALVADPALTGRRVYGLDAWTVTACFLALYLAVALRSGTSEPRTRPRDFASLPTRARALLILHGVVALALLWILVIAPAVGEGLQDAFERSHGADARGGRALAAGFGALVWLGTVLRVQLPAVSRMVWHRPAAHDPLTRELERYRADSMDARRVEGDLRGALLLGAACAAALAWIMLR